MDEINNNEMNNNEINNNEISGISEETALENNEPKAKKKINLLDKLKNMLMGIGGVFKDKPFTMGAIIILAIIFSILIDYDYDNELLDKLLTRSACFLGVFAAQSLFVEEYFRKKLIPKIVGFVLAVLFASFTVYVGYSELETFFGMKYDLFITYFMFFIIVYLGSLQILSIYHMFKCSELSFERYCIDTFCSLVRATVVYALFAGGIAIIILIFNVLIYDTDVFIGRVEIFLAAGIYVPSLLLALSREKESYGKFSKLVMLYVLEPMVMLAYVIIYIYIVKIIITGEMPQNSVFNILSFMFAIAMPIWTMDMGIEEDSNIFVKISRFLPLVFVPFVILQTICMGIRIGAYGITATRYFGVMLILFEISYLILYVIQFITKKQIVKYASFVAIAFLIIMFWIPGINYVDAVINSQFGRIEKLINNDNISDKDKNMVASAYRSCRNVSLEIAEMRFEKRFSVGKQMEIEDYNENYYYYSVDDFEERIRYLHDYRSIEKLDISNYSSMNYVRYSVYQSGFDINQLKKAEFEKGEYNYNGEVIETITLDIYDYIKELEKIKDEDNYSFLDDQEPIKVGDGKYLYVTEASLDYYPISDKIESMYIYGYLFE